jgi:hypothetical protein
MSCSFLLLLQVHWVLLWIFHELLCALLMCNVHSICLIKSYSIKLNAMDHGEVCYFQSWVSPILTSLVKGTIFFLPLNFCSCQILAVNWMWVLVNLVFEFLCEWGLLFSFVSFSYLATLVKYVIFFLQL